MNTLLVEKENKEVNIILISSKGREKINDFFLSGRQKLHWPTSKSMRAFLVTVPHLYQVNDKTVPPGESWYCTRKTGDTY